MVFLKNFKESTTRPTGIFREVEWGEGGGGGVFQPKKLSMVGEGLCSCNCNSSDCAHVNYTA